MRELLSDPALCGWPPERVTVITNPLSATDLAAQVTDLAETATGVLLLYYAAHVPPPNWQATACTSFTGELRDLLHTGIPGKPSPLTFGDIYPVLRSRLRSKGLPTPNQRGTDTAGQFPFAHNAAAAVPVSPGRLRRPSRPAFLWNGKGSALLLTAACIPWRSARTERPWPVPEVTGRSNCGPWPLMPWPRRLLTPS